MTTPFPRPGPGSLTWEVNGERLAIAGWGCAILMQVAHPSIAAGVARHSGFRDGARASVDRLSHTVRAMLALTFGTDEEARAVVARINAIHDRVNGFVEAPAVAGSGERRVAVAAGADARAGASPALNSSGLSSAGLGHAARGEAAGPAERARTYSAHDPDLQAWVHLTMLDSVVRAFDALVRPLSVAERDAYCNEARGAGAWFRMPAGDLPATWDEVQARCAGRMAGGEIAVSAEAREVAREILAPRVLRWLPPIDGAHRLLTVGLLPPALRDAYGLTWQSPRDDRRFERLARAIRATRRATPAVAARWRIARAAGIRSDGSR